VYHVSSLILSYSHFAGGNSAFLLSVVGSAGLSAYAVWVFLFGSQIRVSSVDGSDKRVSGFLFGKGKGKGNGKDD
jgi:hypothetical protein